MVVYINVEELYDDTPKLSGGESDYFEGEVSL